MESELYLLFFLLRFQAEVLLPVGGVVKLILHLLWISRGPPFPGLSTELFSRYREHFTNPKKKKKVKCDLAGTGMYPKELCFGLYSLHKESEQISRLQCKTNQSCLVPVEMRYRTRECKQMWRDFDGFLKRQITFMLLYFRIHSISLSKIWRKKQLSLHFHFSICLESERQSHLVDEVATVPNNCSGRLWEIKTLN